MKLCAIVCEYNPFHNGHRYLIEQAKRISGCDGVVCVMSASFTQRGEMAILDKFTRAIHALKGGADCVIQLPVSFSVAPAEIFACGAIKLIKSIPDVCAIAFGCETADSQLLLKNARILADENEQYKSLLKKTLDSGESYAKSCQTALNGCGGNGDLLNGSNNILALEYAKSIIKANSGIQIIPIERKGSLFNQNKLSKNFSSSRAIRENINKRKIKNNVPDFVYKDIKLSKDINKNLSTYGNLLHFALIKNSVESISQIFGCSEGLENKLKNDALKYTDAYEIISSATTKRYTSSRIRRIMCANLLGLYENDCRQYLDSPLYIKPLAVKKEQSDNILSALSRSDYPIVIRKSDTRNLSESAKKCLEKDEFADDTRGIICGEKIYNFTIKTI